MYDGSDITVVLLSSVDGVTEEVSNDFEATVVASAVLVETVDVRLLATSLSVTGTFVCMGENHVRFGGNEYSVGPVAIGALLRGIAVVVTDGVLLV